MAIHTLLPLTGKRPYALILLLHGVGADGASMLPLARALHQAVPKAVVIAPDAPFASDISQEGFQWFSVRGVTDTNRRERIADATPALTAIIRTALDDHRLDHRQLAVVGFSQGAMMALSLADGLDPPAAIASIAGRLARPILKTQRDHPIMLFTHGQNDPVVPFACLEDANASFVQAGYAVQSLVIPGLGHEIDARQISVIAQFLVGVFAAQSLEVAL